VAKDKIPKLLVNSRSKFIDIGINEGEAVII
jgi:hypothetical protein